jgi:coiled-coil domain-containing protein 12
MSSHEKLSAAANDRKARLAQLKSLKRKQAPTDDASEDASTALTTTSTDPTTASPSTALTAAEEPSVTSAYLSGRNYDSTTRNVKLGFDALPIADPTATLEYKAEQLALSIRTKDSICSSCSRRSRIGT